jgi:hypothetical protein
MPYVPGQLVPFFARTYWCLAGIDIGASSSRIAAVPAFAFSLCPILPKITDAHLAADAPVTGFKNEQDHEPVLRCRFFPVDRKDPGPLDCAGGRSVAVGVCLDRHSR